MRSLLFSLMILMAAAPALAGSDAIEGSWYTEGVENGLRAQFVIENRSDGTFTKRIRDVTNCKAINSWIETGHWSFDGIMYSEITETVGGGAVDSSSTEFRDGFRITIKDTTHFSMFDPKTNVTWLLEKVGSDYAMPPSSGCSV